MEKLALAYGGELWPELSSWDPGEGSNSSRGPVNRTGRKRRKTGQKGTGSEGGTGVLFSP